MSSSESAGRRRTVGFTGSAAVAVRRAVTVAIFVSAGLTFAFGFGNVWALGVQLGVAGWVAPLVAPAVDLSVMALLTALAYLRAHGVEVGLVGPRRLLVFCGVVTLALNTAHPFLAGEYGRAAFDGIAPVLLIFWSDVGPRLLALLHGAVPDAKDGRGPSPVVRDHRDGPSAALVAQARQLDMEHREAHGRPISRDRLRAHLQTSNAVAGEVLRLVRADTA